jgi:divalent metal cation (Fe/Co/Zn/Cd) transporter
MINFLNKNLQFVIFQYYVAFALLVSGFGMAWLYAYAKGRPTGFVDPGTIAWVLVISILITPLITIFIAVIANPKQKKSDYIRGINYMYASIIGFFGYLIIILFVYFLGNLFLPVQNYYSVYSMMIGSPPVLIFLLLLNLIIGPATDYVEISFIR